MKPRNIVMQRPREPVRIESRPESDPIGDYIASLATTQAKPWTTGTALRSWWPRSRQLAGLGAAELHQLHLRANEIGMQAMAKGDRYAVQVCMERMQLCKQHLRALGIE